MRIGPPPITPKKKESYWTSLKETWKESPTAYKATALGIPAGMASSAYPGTWLHEQGHKLAAQALYSDSHAAVHITPFHGGLTTWNAGPLSPLGQAVGPNNASAIAIAAGPCVDLVTGMATFAVGYGIRKQHPNVGAAMMGYAGYRTILDVAYALHPATGAVAHSHDFVNFAHLTGVPPWASAALFAAVLPAEYLLLRQLKKARKA